MGWAVAAVKNNEADKEVRKVYTSCVIKDHPGSPEKCLDAALAWSKREENSYKKRAFEKLRAEVEATRTGTTPSVG